jgi:hypothetical protein
MSGSTECRHSLLAGRALEAKKSWPCADTPAHCDDDAKSAFASCGHAAALAPGSNVPRPDLLDNLVGGDKQRWWDCQTERICPLDVDDRLVACRHLNGQVGGHGAAQNAIDVGCCPAELVTSVRSMQMRPRALTKNCPNKQSASGARPRAR